MVNVYITVGLVGSGKSTYCTNKIKHDSNIRIVNKDSIREMIYGKYDFNINDEPMIHSISVDMVNKLIENNYDVIIDETNITKKHRKEWITNIKYKVNIVFVYFLEHENNLNWRMTNPRGFSRELWESVLNNMRSKFELIDEEELKLYGAGLICIHNK